MPVKTKFTVQVQVDSVWRDIKDIEGEPYTFDTPAEAEQFLDKWHTEHQYHRTAIRVGMEGGRSV